MIILNTVSLNKLGIVTLGLVSVNNISSSHELKIKFQGKKFEMWWWKIREWSKTFYELKYFYIRWLSWWTRPRRRRRRMRTWRISSRSDVSSLSLAILAIYIFFLSTSSPCWLTKLDEFMILRHLNYELYFKFLFILFKYREK